jgi:hypothetical protein
VQLSWRGALFRASLCLPTFFCSSARAQLAEFDTSHSVFYEAPTRTHMFVYSPSADVQVSPWPWLAVRGGWEADVVSGASVSTKSGAAYQTSHPVDVISTASVHDVRNLGRGEISLRGNTSTLTAGYAYSTEHDYRSQSIHAAASTDAYQHNTQFQLSYARNFDSICDRVQSQADPTRWTALEDSTGCFTAASSRTTHPINIDSFEASWGQSWTPILATQLTYSGQVVDGFQGDPYRSVVLGNGIKAQEHDPSERDREALTARVALYLRGIKGAARLSVRAYYDTWAIESGTVEVEFEKWLSDSVRLMVRGRGYKQTGAVFWSDDYTGGPGPRGQYWTGDRELSPFWSWLAGFRLAWAPIVEQGKIAGFFESVKIVGSASMTTSSYEEYTLGGMPVSNARAYVGTASATAAF